MSDDNQMFKKLDMGQNQQISAVLQYSVMQYYKYSALYFYIIGQYIAVFLFTERCIKISGYSGNTMSLM